LTTIDAGGGVEVFASEADAKKRAEYVSSLTDTGNPLFAEYHYRRGRVFLRLSHELTPAQAREYKAALNRLKPSS
jgi:hypothetical protein